MTGRIGATYDTDIHQKIFILYGEDVPVTHDYTMTFDPASETKVVGDEEEFELDLLFKDGNVQLVDKQINYRVIQKGTIETEDTLLSKGHLKTDAFGHATFYYVGDKRGQIEVIFNYNTDCIEEYTFYDSDGYVVTISGSSQIYNGDNLSLSGVVTNGGVVVPDATVTVYQGTTSLGDVTTDEHGVWSKVVTGLTTGTYTFHATCNDSDSIALSVSVIEHTYSLSISTSNVTSITYGQSVTVTATLLMDGEPYGGTPITIYDGSTSLGSPSWVSGGTFTKTLSNLSVGTHTLKAVFGSTESSTVTVTVSKVNTNLSITVPTSLVYSDAFNITGVLTDASNNAINGAYVKLKVGSTVVDTQTTNSSGSVSFTQTPVSMGNHTFQLVFEATTTYNAVNSQTVERTINKETSVLTVTSPTNNSSIIYGNSVSVTGTLKTDDAEAMASKDVVVSESNTTLTTLSTDSNGDFSGSVTGLGVGSHTLTFTFVTDSYYTASTVTRTVVVNEESHNYALALTGTPIIQTGDSDTITATLTDGGSPVASTSLAYQIKHGSTVLSSGTATTNGSGVATVSYTGTGIGDVDVIVSNTSMNLQETYAIEDCLKYLFTSSDTFHSIASSSSMTVSSGVASGYNKLTDFNIPMSSDFEITIDYKCTSSEGGLVFADLTNTNNFDKNTYQILTQGGTDGINFNGYTGTTRSFKKTLSSSSGLNQFNTIKLVKQSGNISAYFNGTLIGTNTVLSNGITNLCIGMYRWGTTNSQSMKNIKVKAL